MNHFHKVDPTEVELNAIKLVGDEGMLITAGTPEKFNTMTATWGGFGMLWNKPVAFTFVRPSRYTFEFLEKYDEYTLSFFGGQYDEALKICGTKSGRDIDKVKETGLHPVLTDNGFTTFDEAVLVGVCKKLYAMDIDNANYLDAATKEKFGGADQHRLYISEIIVAYEK